ncbi:hypothetical protein [Natrinema halophilum]|uniref:DNA recombination and repair protein Rad51-like C-terminal domain-containing protein n=1 Tax=Natrinema halophilum TaxID=1699371 RepID=A0A7D5L370_9EURY|nr:hypothetical protein [Natrinema halophilum]QLG47845.1 hypothetical protein HYG82_02800 [Natrinema halophilum]
MGGNTDVVPSIDQIPNLPTLEEGVTVLKSSSRGAFHALVVDHLLLERPGTAWWIDTHGHAQTAPLADVAPSRRVLKKIQIARTFTAYQHYTLCERLLEDPDYGVFASVDRDDVGLIVVPAVDGLYRDDDLDEDESERTVVSALARLAAAARQYECPVLVSKARDDEFTAPIDNLADERIQCLETDEGARFIGGEFESLVYPVGNGMVQTTLAFWKEILAAREPAYPTPITAGSIREVA